MLYLRAFLETEPLFHPLLTIVTYLFRSLTPATCSASSGLSCLVLIFKKTIFNEHPVTYDFNMLLNQFLKNKRYFIWIRKYIRNNLPHETYIYSIYTVLAVIFNFQCLFCQYKILFISELILCLLPPLCK